jgi:hypothetical protein
MKNKLPMKLTKTEVEEFSAVLGSAPVLTSESGRHYNEIWENLILLRLNRYERRAWSRQRRAILAFMNVKLMKQLESGKAAS